MKKILLALGIVLGILCAFPLASKAQFQKNALCPVMPGNRVKEKFFVDYKGDRIYLCCKSCVKAFKKHPERYLKNLEKA